jgi:hypothetical protein
MSMSSMPWIMSPDGSFDATVLSSRLQREDADASLDCQEKKKKRRRLVPARALVRSPLVRVVSGLSTHVRITETGAS